MAWRVFALDALPDEPWRNGGGRTRTIATQRREAVASDASDADAPPWDWRLSVATIERSGPFSVFPGVARSSVLLGPGQIELSAPGAATLRLQRPGDAVDYPGDTAWRAQVQREGPPLSLLNVMARRAAASARMRVVRDDATVAGHTLAVFAVEGRWRVVDTSPEGDGPQVLAAGHGVVGGEAAWPPAAMRWRIERLSSAGWLAAVAIHGDTHGSR